VTLWCVIEPHDHHLTNNFNARSISWDDHDALLIVCVGVIWVTLAEHEVELCPGITCTTDVPGGEPRDISAHHKPEKNKPFMSVDDYFVSFPSDRRTNVRGIGRCNLYVGPNWHTAL